MHHHTRYGYHAAADRWEGRRVRSSIRERKRAHVESNPSGVEADVSKSLGYWILKNEEWPRNRRICDPTANWRVGLVGLDGISNDVWSASKLGETYWKISRPRVDGFTFVDARKTDHIYIQPNAQRFKDRFERLTNGQLTGLDWSNVFVAGGSVLGSLLCVDVSKLQSINLSSGNRQTSISTSMDWDQMKQPRRSTTSSTYSNPMSQRTLQDWSCGTQRRYRSCPTTAHDDSRSSSNCVQVLRRFFSTLIWIFALSDSTVTRCICSLALREL